MRSLPSPCHVPPVLTLRQMEFDGTVGANTTSLTGHVVLRSEDGEETFRGPFVDNAPHGEACRERGHDGVYVDMLDCGVASL